MAPPVRTTDASGTSYYSGVEANEATERTGLQDTMPPAADRAEAEAAEVTADTGKGAPTLPRAPIGDPIAASAIKANMSTKISMDSAPSYMSAGSAPTYLPDQKPVVAPKGQERGGPLDHTAPAPGNPLDSTAAGNVKPGKQTAGSSSPAPAKSNRGYDPKLDPKNALNDTRKVTIQTSKGPETITRGEYLRRYKEAQEWVGKQMNDYHWGGAKDKGLPAPDRGALNRQAAEKFGLEENWQRINNPIVYEFEKNYGAADKKHTGGPAGDSKAAESVEKEGGATKKGMGVGETVADAPKKGTVAPEKGTKGGAGAAGNVAKGEDVAGAGAKGAGVAGKGAGAAEKAVETAKGVGVGTKVVTGAAKVATTIADVLMPGPQDAIFMILNAFMATVDWKDKAIQQNTETGFAVGMAAALVGASPEYMKSVHDKQPGIREGHKAYDKALQAGYDYVQSLPPEKRKALHDAAFKQLAAEGRKWDPHQDDPNKSKAANRQIANQDLGELAWMVGGTLGPTVKQRFEEVAEQRRQKEMQEQKAYAPHGEHGNKV